MILICFYDFCCTVSAETSEGIYLISARTSLTLFCATTSLTPGILQANFCLRGSRA